MTILGKPTPQETQEKVEASACTGWMNPLGHVLSGDTENVNRRMSRYKASWESFNLGSEQPDSVVLAEGDPHLFNLAKTIAKISSNFLFGKPTYFRAKSGNEAFEEAVREVWEDNKLQETLTRCALYGAVTGDAYIYVSTDSVNSPGRIKITPLRAERVFPVFDPLDQNEMLGVMIQYPISQIPDRLGGNGGEVAAVSPTADSATSVDTSNIYSIYFTAETVTEYIGGEEKKRYQNPYKAIPVFHASNLIGESGFFGDSDIVGLGRENRKLVSLLTQTGSSIEYHADPMVIISGVSAQGGLSKQQNSVYTVQSKDAKVNVVEVSGKMAGAPEYFDRLLDVMCMIGRTPKKALMGLDTVTDTSSAALELIFLPLIEKTWEKRNTYGAMLADVSKFILDILLSQGTVTLDQAENKAGYDRFRTEFSDFLPRDWEKFLDVLTKKKSINAISDAQVIREVEENDFDRACVEILADKRAEVLGEVEKARMLKGSKPSLSFLEVGSLGMSIKDQTVFDEQLDILDQIPDMPEETTVDATPVNSDRTDVSSDSPQA